MKIAFSLLVAAASVLTAASVAARPAPPPVSMQTARASALALVPNGTIRSAELEREHGRLIYSFDILIPHRAGVEEVQISATTGRLVSRTHESPAAEHREARAEGAAHGRR
jgi:uncharacterized membrane protein YkoI